MIPLPKNLPPAIESALTEYAEHYMQENYGSGHAAVASEKSCKSALMDLSMWCSETLGPETKPHPHYLMSKDGDQWCVSHTDFVNLGESHAGFGNTIEAAIKNLADWEGK